MATKTPSPTVSHDPFSRIKVGQVADVIHHLTDNDVQVFANLTGDDNPLHLDEAFAARTQFRRPVAHGMLSASFISTLIGTELPGEGALWLSQSLNFRAPAFVGDTIRVSGTVKQVSPATRMLVITINVTNQDEHTIISGEATVMMPKLRETAKTSTGNSGAVLVTGGSGGIGAAIARTLGQQGYTVVLNYHRDEQSAATVVAAIEAEGGRALAIQANVASPEAVQVLFQTAHERVGPILSIVHCASPPLVPTPFANLQHTTLRQHFDVQVCGAMNCAQAALPAMVEAGKGALVFIGSTVTDNAPPPQQTDYVVAKAALGALARCLTVEYGPKGIRVNVIAPGMTTTDMIRDLPEKAKLLARMQAPLRRLGDPQDIADAAAFLLSPQARHITGTTLRVSGGASMG